MMKKIILCLILFSADFAGKGQNLVPNGDLEQYSSCPTSMSQLDKLLFWFNPAVLPGGGSPDYFNLCAPVALSIPNNFWGFQPARSDRGYSGIYLRTENLSEYREYMEVPLTSALIANGCYHFEMYVNLGNICRYTTDDIGIYFSDTVITGINNYNTLPYNPQINNATGNTFDSLNWILVSGNYTAHGGESYLIIGNFKNDANTDTIVINNSATYDPYVYIDDVSLSLCTGTEEIPNSNNQFLIYPNPVKDYLKINFPLAGKEKVEIKITDILGKEILRQQINLKSTTLNLQSLQNGIYFIEINDACLPDRQGKNIYRKKFLKE